MQKYHELEDLEEKISRSIRMNGSYSIPTTAVYAPAIAILERLVADGMLEFVDNDKIRVYTATSKMKKSILVREVQANKIRVGQAIGQRKGDFVSKVNNRSHELSLDDIEFYGVVKSIETKMIPKNVWEAVTFQKNVMKTVIHFKHKKIVVDPEASLVKIK